MKLPIPEFMSNMKKELLEELGVALIEDDEDTVEIEASVSQEELEKLPVYQALRDSVDLDMSLDELIDAFAAMCKLPVGDPDDLLFETGTFDFTGKKLFYFSLVRQFRFQDEDEFVQLHLDVRYAPAPATKRLSCTEWSSLTERDFFDLVRSPAYLLKRLFSSPMRQGLRLAALQAQSFDALYGDRLSEQQRTLIQAFGSTADMGLLKRDRIYIRYRLLKSGFIRRLSQLMGL